MAGSSSIGSEVTDRAIAGSSAGTIDLNAMPDIIPVQENQLEQAINQEKLEQHLPFSKVLSLIRKVVPSDAGVHEDFVKGMIDCASKFAKVIYSEAKERCVSENHAVIKGDELVWAVDKIGHSDMARCLSFFLYRYREMERYRRDIAVGNPLPIPPQRSNPSFVVTPLQGDSMSSLVPSQRGKLPFHVPSQKGKFVFRVAPQQDNDNLPFPISPRQVNMSFSIPRKEGNPSLPQVGSLPHTRPIQIPMQMPRHGIIRGNMQRPLVMTRSQQVSASPRPNVQIPSNQTLRHHPYASVLPNQTIRYHPYAMNIHGYQYWSQERLTYPRANTSGGEEGDTGEASTSDYSTPLPFTFI